MTIRPWRVALLGGTFDPIHAGHLAAARAVLDQDLADEVIFVPAGQPPHKGGPRASAAHRWCMTVLATLCEPRYRVARWETERTGPTYALDTVRIARAALKAESARPFELSWVIGTDAMALIYTWHEVESLFQETAFLVVSRTGDGEAPLRESLAIAIPWASPERVTFVEMPPVEASSTSIRERLASSRPVPELPPAVGTYIQRYGLYQGAEVPHT